MTEPEPAPAAAAPPPPSGPPLPVDPEAALAADVAEFRSQLKSAMPRVRVSNTGVVVNAVVFAAMAVSGVSLLLSARR